MKSRSTSRLTTTMLSQLEQNEYLRVKLIQLQKVSRQKDNFYLSIFRQQQKVTQKVLSQLFLAQEKIKTLIRQRICNNWKQQYDTLATNITSYVKDVNCLIEEYRKTKQKLQQKAYKTNDLYEYYSNTLEQCGKKFDQAQIIIQELNNNISELKQTVKSLDNELQQKLVIINQQDEQVKVLRHMLKNNSQVQDLKRWKQSNLRTMQSLKKSNKKLQKDNQALERSIKQMQKLVVEMKKQLHKKQNQNKQLLQQIQHKDQVIKQAGEMVEMGERQHEEIDNLRKTVEQLNNMIKAKEQEIKQLNKNSYGSNLRRPQVEFITTFNPLASSTNPMTGSTFINSPSYSQNLHQLHLKKILQQQETIKNLNNQLKYANNNIQRVEIQKIKLLQAQKTLSQREEQLQKQVESIKQLYNQKENQLKRQFQSINFKYIQSQFNSKQRQQQVKNIQLYGQKCQQQIQDWKLQMQGLYEELSNKQIEIQQLYKRLKKTQQQLNQIQKQLNDLQTKADLLEKANSQLFLQNQQLKNANNDYQNQHLIFQERLRIYQKEKQQSKQNFQDLLNQFQEFVKQNEHEKIKQQQIKRQSLILNPFEVHQGLFIKNKIVSVLQNPRMKKKPLSIDVDKQQDLQQKQGFKKGQFIHNENSSMNKTKKFNLQSLQQKANPYHNFPYSPKIGEIFDSMHIGRKIPSSRW